MKKNMNKTTKNNFITYGMVIAIFVIVEILSATGNLSNLLMGLMVPLCVYTIASISLNLVVGFSGELSLGHAGEAGDGNGATGLAAGAGVIARIVIVAAWLLALRDGNGDFGIRGGGTGVALSHDRSLVVLVAVILGVGNLKAGVGQLVGRLGLGHAQNTGNSLLIGAGGNLVLNNGVDFYLFALGDGLLKDFALVRVVGLGDRLALKIRLLQRGFGGFLGATDKLGNRGGLRGLLALRNDQGHFIGSVDGPTAVRGLVADLALVLLIIEFLGDLYVGDTQRAQVVDGRLLLPAN